MPCHALLRLLEGETRQQPLKIGKALYSHQTMANLKQKEKYPLHLGQQNRPSGLPSVTIKLVGNKKHKSIPMGWLKNDQGVLTKEFSAPY